MVNKFQYNLSLYYNKAVLGQEKLDIGSLGYKQAGVTFMFS